MLGSGGYYSIIGIPNSGPSTLSPEVRSYATPQLSGNITALMQQNQIGVFTPVNVSATAGVTLDLSLLPTVLAPPSQWPVAPNGSDAVCPAGDEPCQAYKWISYNVTCPNGTVCSEDIRGHYADTNVDLNTSFSLLVNLSYPSQPTVNPPGFVFSQPVFNTVVAQLKAEIAFALDVQKLFGNFQTVINDLAQESDLSLQNVFDNVVADVKPAQSAKIPFNIPGVLRDALMVSQVVASVAQPELVPAFALLNAGLYLQMQFNNAPSGASGNQIIAAESALLGQIQSAFTNSSFGNGQAEIIVLSDWEKLQTIGKNIESANSSTSGPWYWTPTTATKAATSLQSAYTVSFYQSLMASKYQIVTFFDVPFNNPSDYSYSYGCDPHYAVCCCSGSIYSPPSGAFQVFPGGSVNDIYMAISPSDGSYPSNALTTTLFTTMHLFASDFFLTTRGWSAVTGALPQGWSDYQNNGGACGNPNTSCGVPQAVVMKLRHGLPGAALAPGSLRPLASQSAVAKLIASAKRRPRGPRTCGVRRF